MTAYASFGLLGAFWGMWSAAIPSVREHADVTDGQFSVALLALGVGSLPAMLAMGRIVDRLGQRPTLVSLWLLAATGFAVVTQAEDFVALLVGLCLLGCFSGAANVGANAAAVGAQRRTAIAVVARAHGVFSGVLVMSILGSAAVFELHLSDALPFAVLVGTATLVAALLPTGSAVATHPALTGRSSSRRARGLLLLIGSMGALAFAIESTHQAWTAVYLAERFELDGSIALLGPAIFYTTVAAARLVLGVIPVNRHRDVIISGGCIAACGTLVVAVAPNVPLAIAGLVTAAAGTAVLFPMLLSVAAESSQSESSGSNSATVTTVSYLGFLLGPGYVGAWAAGISLQSAFIAVASLGLVISGLSRWRVPSRRHGRLFTTHAAWSPEAHFEPDP